MRPPSRAYSIGQCNLGRMYSTGRGVTKDEAEAVTWEIASRPSRA